MTEVFVHHADVAEMRELLKRRTLEGLGLIGQVEELREVLKECSDDLADLVALQYPKRDTYPQEKRRYERDMETVERARALLRR